MRPLSELAETDRVLLWDLDGTIADTRRDIASGVAGLLRDRGLTPLSLEAVLRNVGRGIRVLVSRSLEQAGAAARDEADLTLAVETFRVHYRRHLMDTTVPYDGMPGLLRALHQRGRRMGVVSNKTEDFTREILDRLDLLDCFRIVIGGDTYPERKPDPEPLLRAIHLCDPAAHAERAVMIGDSITDLRAARSAGMLACAVGWGIDPDGELAGAEPDWRIETPAGLRRAILGGNG